MFYQYRWGYDVSFFSASPSLVAWQAQHPPWTQCFPSESESFVDSQSLSFFDDARASGSAGAISGGAQAPVPPATMVESAPARRRAKAKPRKIMRPIATYMLLAQALENH